ncbi:tetratricopeptide repeat protein [Hufsiella ginkgonis]|uniref:Tetratricopeptide repeat protein n=1 Tax=Hufsiella ginkgonis TaxID=2695274 RepID=A0A7K1XWE8_9SPHI|nr:tetratricopeptide repeat protein [Hufsiella ginkgonis]MXV15324.1 hypothetical protein [Hufsiella ginkgonis]
MKNSGFILGLALLISGATTYAQKSELTNAKKGYEEYQSLRSSAAALSTASLKKAQVAIDKATIHEKTLADPEVWSYRANIYAGLASLDTINAKIDPMIAESAKAIKKATELDTKGEQKANIAIATETLASIALNKGVRAYKSAKYGDAFKAFEESAAFSGAGKDTTALYYSAISAQNAKDYQGAIKQYTALLSSNYSMLEDVYSNLSILYASPTVKDTAAAIRIAGEGVKRFPKNSVLATREIEFSLMTGKEKEIIGKIDAQAAKEPTNKLLPYYLGIAYNSLKDYKKAEDAYKRAIAIDPSFDNANINLGGLIMNSGIEIYNATNKLPASKTAEYKAGMAKANAEFDRALPYLEKSTQLNPKSELAWRNLRTYYMIKNNQAKVDEVQKKLDEL